jgi:hypothetical protein
MELWGTPAVTALIDSRGKLTNAQVGEKLPAEIERERSRPKPEGQPAAECCERFRHIIHGNAHMVMLEKNNLQVAGLIAEWLARTIPAR